MPPRIRYQMKIDHDIPLQPSHAVGRAAVKQDTRSTRWRSATVSSSPRTESIQFVSSSAAARMLVDTSLATTAMPIVAGAQPNYQGPQKPYRGRSHCLMRSPELVERIDRASADAPLARPPMWRNAGLPLGREKLFFRLVAFTAGRVGFNLHFNTLAKAQIMGLFKR